MTDLDRDAIRARAEATTPGPWMVIDPNEGSGHAPFWQVVNDAFLNPIGDGDSPWLAAELHTGVRADAEFIAHARTDIPTLLARLAEVEGDHAKLGQRYVSVMTQRDALAAGNARLRQRFAEYDEAFADCQGEFSQAARECDYYKGYAEALKADLDDSVNGHDETCSILAERDAMRQAVRKLHEPTLQTVEWWDDETGKGEALCCPSCRTEDPTSWNPPMGQADVKPEGFVAAYVLSPCPTLDSLQDGPSAPLPSPLSPSQPELVPDSTDGVGEQGEAQGACVGSRSDRFWLWASDAWHEVDKATYVRTERQAGFRNAMGQPDEPATASFSSGELRGTMLDPNRTPDREQIPGSSIHSEGGSGREETDPNRAIAEKIWDEVSAEHGLPSYDLPISAVATYAYGANVTMSIDGDDRVFTPEEFNAHLAAIPPADPPWLEEAIEAAARRLWVEACRDYGCPPQWETDKLGAFVWQDATAAIRAALPHITGGVLEGAADEIKHEAGRVRAIRPGESGYNDAVVVGLVAAERMLREQARRVTS